MQEPNRYSPPVAQVADVAAPAAGNLPRVFRTSGVVVAALVGGALGAGYLVYLNLKSLGQLRSAQRSVVTFGVLTVVFVGVARSTPSDFISQLLSVVMPQLILVLAAYRWLQEKPNSGAGLPLFRSNWLALGVGVLANLAIKAVLFGVYYAVS